MSYVTNAFRGSAFHEAGFAIVARYFGLRVVGLQILADGHSVTDVVGAPQHLPLVDQVAIRCAGQASRTVFKCRSHALSDVEISELVEGLTDEERVEIRNAGFRRAIEIIKTNGAEVERLAGDLIDQRRTNGAASVRLERMIA
jgi:hypothetical protein